MSKVFFTGCLHFDHENIIGLANRPFADINEMNHTLVENWNKEVNNNDEVFVLGDFVYGKEIKWGERAGYWNKKLNGRKHLILGNHDNVDPALHMVGDHGFRSVFQYLDLKRNAKHFVLFHYPMEDWDRRYQGSIHLHCHTHQRLLERPLLPYVQESALKGHPSDAGGLDLPVRYPPDQLCNRFNVTVEATDYRPISMQEILDRSVYKA